MPEGECTFSARQEGSEITALGPCPWWPHSNCLKGLLQTKRQVSKSILGSKKFFFPLQHECTRYCFLIFYLAGRVTLSYNIIIIIISNTFVSTYRTAFFQVLFAIEGELFPRACSAEWPALSGCSFFEQCRTVQTSIQE